MKRVNHLLHEIAHLNFREPTAALDQVVQRLVGAEVHDQVDVLKVFEEVNQAHDVFVLHVSLNTYLSFKLSLAIINVSLSAGISRLKVSLRNDLTGVLFLVGCDFDHAVACCEATFPQPFSFDITHRWLT